ncbi:hypothetical protein Bpfe_019180 [Biomphalaria pfeifferi]|uniref:Uncharacterized protein n=1 Tax=Biomphalaria pfeifferi TaxID=112525 RepID=A0AAD8BBN8_BIOPF|nr:hypothetical protein Bpfe_019180 [Biomphalaria pfeifferi]
MNPAVASNHVMGCKKTAAILVVVCLTVLNVWLARNIISAGSGQVLVETKPNEKPRTKMSDILVIAIEDVHPIDHLQEAQEMEAKISRQTSSSSPVVSDFSIRPVRQTSTQSVRISPVPAVREIDPDAFANLKIQLDKLKLSLLTKQKWKSGKM